VKIAFDALPLLGRKTGIGYCEAGQVNALTKLHPEHEYQLNYFAVRHLHEREKEIQPYLASHVHAKHAFCSPYGYRILSSFVPVPYGLFFGNQSEITHFFNYIIPPGVPGKKIVTVHDMVYKACPETVRSRTRHMLDLGLVKSMRRADRIVTDSEFSKSEIIKYYPRFANKIRVVPCGVDRTKFFPVHDDEKFHQIQNQYHLPEDYFLYLGTLEPRKNLGNLIKAYGEFVKSHGHPAELVLAGAKGWLYDGIFRQVQSLKLEHHVLFTEYIADEDLPVLMSQARAFVFPSLYEGFGMPPLEAMACGCPVLVSDTASLPEVTGDSAVLVKPDDIYSIADGMHQLFTDDALRKSLSRSGLKRAEALSWKHSAELLYQVYQEVLSEG